MDAAAQRDRTVPSTKSENTPNHATRIGSLQLILALALLYFLTGKLGLRLAIVHPSATAVWPGTGLALAAILLFGYRAWPGIFIGAFLVNLTTAGSFLTAVGIASGNTLEAVVGALLLMRFANGRRVFDRAEDIFKFVVFAGLLATAISATLGTASLSFTGFLKGIDPRPVWFTWWLGDMVGAILIAPCFLLWPSRNEVSIERSTMPRRVAALVSLILSGLFVFNGSLLFGRSDFPLKFLCIPLVVWAAFELRRYELPLAIIAFSGLAVGSTLSATGSPITNESLLLLQIFLAVVATTGLLISAAVWERNRHERALRKARTDLEVRVAERTRELQGLSARLLHVEDQERRRIARELHDSTGQSIAVIIMMLSQLAKALAHTHPELSARAEELSEIARGLSDEVRTTSYLLHPPLLDEAGLQSALEWYGRGFEERSKINVALDVSDKLGRLPPDIELMVFRAVQESLTNVHRHSKSKTVDIRLFRSADALTLEIEDQGLGILPDKLKAIAESRTAGVGVRGMRERFTAVGGELNIVSEGHGTLVRGVVPLKPHGSTQPSSDEQPAVGIRRE